MGADFYTDDYAYGGGGGYYDGGGFAPDLFMESDAGYGWGDIGAGGDFNYGYGFDQGLPPDYAPGYGPETGGVLDTGLQQGSDLFGSFFDYYSAQGYDDYTAMQMAAQDASAGSIVVETQEQGPLPSGSLPTIPLNSFYDYWQSPPYVPDFGEYFPLPPPPTDQTQLPGYCPQGTYHPINDPYSCVPFPQATTNQQQQQQRPTGQQQPAPSAPRASAPQQQQQACPTGYCKHPTTGRCIPIPAGYMRHPQTQVCTAQTAQASPLPAPSETQDLLSNLKSLPWWVWLAAGGLLLLSRGEERTTTVRYRRAS